MRPALRTLSGLFVFATLGATSVGQSPIRAQGPDEAIFSHRFGPGPIHKVILDAEQAPYLELLREMGAVAYEVDYGAFHLVLVDEKAFGGAAELRASGLSVRDEHDLIGANGFILDGAHPKKTLSTLLPEEMLAEYDPAAGLYLVQFVGPVEDGWLEELRSTGARIIQYVAMNGYVVSADPTALSELGRFKNLHPAVQYVGAWQPAFRMSERIRSDARGNQGQPLPVIIQLVESQGVREILAALDATTASIDLVYRVGPYLNVQAKLDPIYFRELARQKEVFAIQRQFQRERRDERQGQIGAGNVSGSSPSGPGYLSWLASAGFNSGQFGSFSVNVVDDAYFLTGHPDIPNSRIDFSLNPTSQSGTMGGHGFLNAHIVAGFNDQSGSTYNDSSGYNYGLGIAPWAHVGSTAIFGPGGASSSNWESNAYNNGARISTNSWTYVDGSQNPIPRYDANAQEYDFLVRDARSAQGGNQEYLIVFSSGNDGPSSNTVSTPATAKNVLTVGASENDRQTGTDGCGVPNSGANNVNDLISFSSKGPVNSSGGDGRWKPEIVSQGTHVQAGIPQSSYNGSSVCNQYWPPGSSLYGWSSGTSHSTPAVAGGAALVRQYFLNQAMPAPSPAMNKAVLVNSAEYLTGANANDTLPSNGQGMGRMHFGRAFDGTPTIYVDQTQVFGSTGQTHVVTGDIADSGEPFRVSLVWTDAPGSSSGSSPWVNDLDLTVDVGGSTYRGNVFTGAFSTTGGSADFKNNVESVFRPAGTTGSFTVTVTASSINGDGVPANGDSTDQDFALVIHNGTTGPVGPSANFSANPTSGVAPLTVDFTDTSSGTINTWLWNFGDGGSSTAQNPSHQYTTTGTYTVSLGVSGPNGTDLETKTDLIDVLPPGINDGSFENQTAGNTPATPWSVTFGSGHVISPSGVSSDNGMPDHGTRWCEIAADSTDDATPPSNPGGLTNPPVGGAGVAQSFQYEAGKTELEFAAAFLRNEDANSQYNDWMSVDITDGSTTQNLYYKDTFSPAPNTSTKHGFAMTPVETVTVDLATLFPSSTTATLFTVTAQVGNDDDNVQPSKGYVDNFVLNSVAPAPVAEFSGSPTSGTVPLLVNFSDLSSGGTVTSWSWDFGDTNTSTLQNPSHTYTTAGTYTVSLTATGPGGNDTETKAAYITVNEQAPIAEFSGSPTSGDAPLVVNFTDLSTGGPGTSWSWDFGDTGSSTLQNPSHAYTTAGTYTVSLTVTGPGGNDTETKTAYIDVTDPPPAAEFSGSPTSGTVPLTVNFSDLTSGPTTSWSWNFGDTNTSTLQNPSHTYTTAGVYTVSLTATGPGGSDTETKTAYITVDEEEPIAEFNGSPTTGTLPLTVNFTDLSSGGPVTSWSWNFGDTNTSTLQNPSHTYTTAGVYTVSLTATGPGGNDTETKTSYITVDEQEPIAEFSGSPTTGTLPLTVNFSDLSSAGGPVTSWSWNFGDTNTSTLQNPSHTYTTAGVYTVSLTATGPGGNDTETKTSYITVDEQEPIAEFSGSPTTGTLPLTVNFSDLSSAGGPVTSWSWNFGDTNTSTLQNPSHTYTTAGTYTVSLTATGPGGNDTETKTAYITVNEEEPIAEFSGTPTTGTLPLTVNFTDLSSAGGPVTSWSWNFGDTNTSTLQNPSHTYTTAGVYTVSLTATGPGGNDTETKTAYITVDEQAPVAEFSGSPTTGTVPLTVNFSDLSSGGPATSWSWNFGDTNSSTLQNPSHTYTTAGTYTVSLTATGPGGNDTETKTSYITVDEQAPVAEFSGSPTTGTVPLTVNFSDLSSGGPATSWSWNFGDTNTSTLQNPSHTYTTAGTYTVSLTATGPGGNDTETKTAYITVDEQAPVAEFSGSPTTGTVPLTVNFSDLSSGGPVTSWSWDFGDTNSSTSQNPSHTYTTAGIYTVSLTVTGPGGNDTEIKTAYITVGDQAPIAEFSGTPTSGDVPFNVNFTDLSSAGGPVTSWSWDFGDTSSSTSQNPSHSYTASGLYTVSLTVTGPGGNDTEIKVGYIDVSDPWEDLGNGLAGTHGVPLLTGDGTLVGGSDITISLTNALENSLAVLIVGTSALNAPFKGGTLVPNTDVLLLPLLTDGSGEILLTDTLIGSPGPGSTFYFQYWVQDGAGPVGYSASNAVRQTAP